MTIEQQFTARLKSLAARAATLDVDPSKDDSPEIHVQALLTQISALLDKANANASLDDRMYFAVRIEELLRFADELRSQYTTAQNAKILRVASYVASECYEHVVRRVPPLGGKSAVERWTEPAVLLEPMRTPATFVRDKATRAFGLSSEQYAQLPFPIVLMPPYPLSAMPALCLIHHEVGHNLDEDLGLSAGLRPGLEAALEAAKVAPNLIGHWLDWLKEVVADAFGAILAGPAFGLELASWAQVEGDDNARLTRTHPFPSLRVKLSEELLAQLGEPPERARVDVLAAATTSIADSCREQLPLVARVLCETKLPGLNGACLRDLAPDVAAEAQQVRDAAHCLLTGEMDLELPFRLYPSAARLAAAKGGDVEQVSRLLLEGALRGRKAVPFSAQRYLETTLNAAVPPLLDEAQDGLKLPPPSLFANARCISFVGATNDGLPALFAAHVGARKRRIEIFSLCDAALKGVDGGGRSAGDVLALAQKRREGLTRQLLDGIADEWALFEYDEPFVFASYWDAEERGGRIHTSAHGWGQDIKRAPSHDYVWPSNADQAERSYRFYLQALESLRASATKVADSRPVP